jgi:hypothetical protein
MHISFFAVYCASGSMARCGSSNLIIGQKSAMKRHSRVSLLRHTDVGFAPASGRSIRNVERCVIGICDHSSNGVRAPASLTLLDVVNQRYRSFIGTRYSSKLHFFGLLQSNRLRSNLDSPHHCHVMQHSV